MYEEINVLLAEKRLISRRIETLNAEINELAVRREKIRDKVSLLCCIVEPTIKATNKSKRSKKEVLDALLSAIKNDPTFMDRVNEELT